MNLSRRESLSSPINSRAPSAMLERLKKRRGEGNFRELAVLDPAFIDFCSNDYLGFSQSGLLRSEILRASTSEEADIKKRWGSTGARLISGNSNYAVNLEAYIAKYHHCDSALLFSSGYQANVGLISSLPSRHDSVIYDQSAHASIIDGARLSLAKRKLHFDHNDCDNLKRKIQSATGDVYVVVESVYSMDGDFAPLDDLVEVCSEFGAFLIVDEAHAVGVFGPGGKGRVVESGLEKEIFARTITFGKAMGAHGAAILSSRDTFEFLVNFSRPFIYSTSLDFDSLKAIRAAYSLLESRAVDPLGLFLLINEFRQEASKALGDCMLDSYSPIQGVILGSAEKAKLAASRLSSKHFGIKPIYSPTVPKGSERIRICLHSFNSSPEVQALIHELSEVKR